MRVQFTVYNCCVKLRTCSMPVLWRVEAAWMAEVPWIFDLLSTVIACVCLPPSLSEYTFELVHHRRHRCIAHLFWLPLWLSGRFLTPSRWLSTTLWRFGLDGWAKSRRVFVNLTYNKNRNKASTSNEASIIVIFIIIIITIIIIIVA